MHTFAQKPKATQQTTSAKSTIPGRGHFGQSHEVRSILHLQRTIGNQAVQRMLQTDAGQPEAELTGPASPRFGHDFSRIPIHPPAAGAIQTKLAINKLGDEYEQEADRVAEQVMRMPEPRLQRTCACGGECPKCQTEKLAQGPARLQTKHVGSGDLGQTAVPPIVHDVLRSSGQPLDAATRAFFEPRFGYDFSNVLVHTNAKASESAEAVRALAYTVGNSVVFRAGQYQPASKLGQQLLAHELTHVVQQTGRLQRLSIGVEPKIVIGQEDDELEREAHDAVNKMNEDERAPVLQRATSVRLQRAPADDAEPKAEPPLNEKEDKLLKNCIKKAGPDPDECDRTTALTWADFTGTPPDGGIHFATTESGIKSVEVPSQVCSQKVTHKTTGPTKRFKAFLVSGKSWVKASVKNASDVTKNGCASYVSDCKTYFDKKTSAKKVGAPWSISPGLNAQCLAAINPRGEEATLKNECVTVVGTDCTNAKRAESSRLLRHEQGHYDISCVIAKKANAALIAGGKLDKIQSSVTDELAKTQGLYDTETENGCRKDKQSDWQTEIAKGLPAVIIS